MAEWLDKIHEAQSEVRDVAYGLCDLAESFARTGNMQVAQELRLQAKRLVEADKAVGEGVSLTLNEQLRGADEMTGNLFRAVLAGAIVSVGEGEEREGLVDVGRAAGLEID